ncbi:LuxR family transcriptional regulator, partial [Rhodococcus koreensis]
MREHENRRKDRKYRSRTRPYDPVMISGWPLTGRAEELSLISEAIRGGKSSGIVVAGAAGVGKTRLVREALADAASRGIRTRWIAATQSAQSVPLGAFTEVVSNFGPDPGLRVREVIDALIGTDQDERGVIGIDDAHLLDDLSALVVHQLALRKVVRLVINVRSGEPAPDAVTSMWKERLVERLDLQPLSLDETHTLLETVLDGQLDSLSVRRLWALSHGNALYLRQLVDEELSSCRLRNVAGVWIWDGEPVISPGLCELVAARMGRLSPEVCGVVDALAQCEPLDADVLERVAGCDAVEQAETQGLIALTLDQGRRRVRLVHPLFGEVRRAHGGALRMARIRGQIATELAVDSCVDMRDTVRHAILTLDSNLDPNPKLFLNAARCAMKLLDLTLAERLVHAAVRSDAGVAAHTLWAITLTTLGRGDEAQRALAQLQSSGLTDSEIATTSTVRAAIVLWMIGNPMLAQQILDSVEGSVQRSGVAGPHAAVQGSLYSATGNPTAAIRCAESSLSGPLDDFHTAIATFALVISLGELGRSREMRDAANGILEIAARSAEASQLEFALGHFQAAALRVAGSLDEMAECGQRLCRQSINVPGNLSALAAMLRGHSDLAFGRLAAAVRWLREARAEYAIDQVHASVWRALNLAWLTEALGKLGDVDAAREAAHELGKIRPTEFAYVDMDCALAQAWVCAAEGTVSEAIATARGAAAMARHRGQAANEVLCLQTATQFGDATTARRLTELATQVQGPRATAAAAHAVALVAADGDALQEVARRYGAFGDRVAAADAGAQAAVAFTAAGLRGGAMMAHAAAQRLAGECERA